MVFSEGKFAFSVWKQFEEGHIPLYTKTTPEMVWPVWCGLQTALTSTLLRNIGRSWDASNCVVRSSNPVYNWPQVLAECKQKNPTLQCYIERLPREAFITTKWGTTPNEWPCFWYGLSNQMVLDVCWQENPLQPPKILWISDCSKAYTFFGSIGAR